MSNFKKVISTRVNNTEIINHINKFKNEITNLKNENTNLKNENTNLKNENTKLKNENTNLNKNNTLIDNNILLLERCNNLLTINNEKHDILVNYKTIIEKLNYELTTLKKYYNTNEQNYMESDDE